MERQDRRRHPRLALDAPCKVLHEASGRFAAGRTLNVSRSGALIELEPGRSLLPGEPIWLGIDVSARSLLDPDSMIAGRVVWAEAVRGSPRPVAVEFDELLPEA